MKLPLSVLDLAPVSSGSTPSEALRNTLELARLADRLGFIRYWFAEHHNIPSVASSSPEVLIEHVASATERIRVGSGGIRLPNHTPLRVAETFHTLEALHPGRIDLGLRRAPGTDPATPRAPRPPDSHPAPPPAGGRALPHAGGPAPRPHRPRPRPRAGRRPGHAAGAAPLRL